MVPLRLFENPVRDNVVDDCLNAILFSDPLGLERFVLEVVLEHVLVRMLVFDVVLNSVQQYACANASF